MAVYCVTELTDLKVYNAMSQNFDCIVNQNMKVQRVIDLILQNKWEEVIIVNETRNIIGIVTKDHLMKTISDPSYRDKTIKEVCNKDVITTTYDQPLVEARDIMDYYKIGRLPVLDYNQKFIGVLTAREVCNGFSFKMEQIGKYMHSIMENIKEAIQVIDCDGSVTYWNSSAEKLYGIKSSQIIGKKLADYLPDHLLLRVIADFKPYYNIMSELSDHVYVVSNAVPVTSKGEIVGAVCTTLDVSHTKHLINKLDETNQKVNKLKRIVGLAEDDHEGFYTEDEKMQRILFQAQKAAKTDATVLIQGESGTGKELIANIIYKNSKRAGSPFIEINCTTIPENLFESEMFGYESGAFTGGKKSGQPGKFEIANAGTIFLDEIGDLPLEMQAKLLRVLQEKNFYRVGGTTPISCDVRVIAATNKDLAQLVEQNLFREDLYYRLNVVAINIPPLRERKGDIPGLMNKFLRDLALEYERTINHIDKDFIDILSSYWWPGNVRQLRNVLESVVIFMEGDRITLKSLEDADVKGLLDSEDRPDAAENAVHYSGPTTSEADLNLDDLIFDHQKEIIVNALVKCNYNKTQTARLLGIPRSTLYYKLKQLDIGTPDRIPKQVNQ